MAEWTYERADNFCYRITDGTHDSPKPQSFGRKLITSKHLKGHYIDFESANWITEEDYQKIIERSNVDQWDILYSMIGTIGNLYIEKNSRINYACKNMGIFKFNGKKEDAYWMYYYLKSPQALQYIQSHLRGSTQSYVPLGSLREMPVMMPPNDVRNRIVKILKSIDDRIENNDKINNNLEQQIESILLSILESPNANKVNLGDYLYIKGRIGWKGLKKDEYLERSDYRIINGESLTKAGIDWAKAGFITKERYDESPEIMLTEGDILLSKDGTIGKIGYIDSLETPTTVASGIFVIRNQQPEIISTTFIYYLLKSRLFDAFIAARTEGSVIPHLYQKDFMQFEFPLPNQEEMKSFGDLVDPMFALITSNLHENERLSAIRDAILPRLMSGEIDVSAVEI